MTTKTTKQTLKKIDALLDEPFSLGSFLAAIREGEELNQVEFGKILGISRQNVCDIEHGRRLVSPKLAAQFAIKLGYSVDQFVQLALQAIVDRDGIPASVELKMNKTKMHSSNKGDSAYL